MCLSQTLFCVPCIYLWLSTLLSCSVLGSDVMHTSPAAAAKRQNAEKNNDKHGSVEKKPRVKLKSWEQFMSAQLLRRWTKRAPLVLL